MGRSQKWLDLRSPMSKIQDISFVGTDDLIIFRKFHNFPWNIVAVARWESYFVVGSLDLTWWPDLTWPWAEIFTKVAEIMGSKEGENPAALRAAVFLLSSKNLRGGRSNAPPPSRARVKGRVPPFLHKVVLRRANQPHNSHEDRFSMLWPSRTQSPPKNQITMVKVSGKHIWWHQICLPDTLTIVIWLLGGDCVRLGQSIEKRSSWELWGWFALLKTTLCKKGGTLPLTRALEGGLRITPSGGGGGI